eukprot:scaffold97129_cov63-Phaeocystis_antarctica.AAC.4
MGQRSRCCSSPESLCCAAVSWSLTLARSLRRAAAVERSFDGGVAFDAGGGLGALHGDGDAGCAALRGRGGVGLGEGLGMRDAKPADMLQIAMLGF